MNALSAVQVPAPAGGMSDSEVIAAPVTCTVERFAGAHPSHCVGPFRLYGRGWPYLSIGTCDRDSSATSYVPATPPPTPDPLRNGYDPLGNPVSQPPVSGKAPDSCPSHKTIPRTRFHLSASCCSKNCKP